MLKKMPKKMSRAIQLDDHLKINLLKEMEEHSGITTDNLLKLYSGSVARVPTVLMELQGDEFSSSVPVYRTSRMRVLQDPDNLRKGERIISDSEMNYIEDEYTNYLHARDGVAVNGIRGRIRAAREQDHRPLRPHRAHTVQQNDVITALRLCDKYVAAGWRDRVNIPDVTQLAPDGVLTMAKPFGLVRIRRMKTTVYEDVSEIVRQELAPFLQQDLGPDPFPFLFICSELWLVQVVLREARRLLDRQVTNLRVVAATDEEVTLKPLDGMKPVVQRAFFNEQYFLEYERSATTAGPVREKVESYVKYAREHRARRVRRQINLLMVAEKERVEQIIREESEQLMREYECNLVVVTSSYEKVSRNLKAYPNLNENVWTFQGNPIPLL